MGIRESILQRETEMTEQNRDATETEEKGFQKWKRAVNKEVCKRIFLTCDDLPDVDYFSMYQDGTDPADAATEVIENAGGDTSIL